MFYFVFSKHFLIEIVFAMDNMKYEKNNLKGSCNYEYLNSNFRYAQ